MSVLHAGLEAAAARTPGGDAIVAGDDRWTWSDLDGLANAAARHLRDRGVGPGDRVAVMLTNRVEVPIVVHAISKLGGAAVMLSPAWKAAEVDHAVSLTDPVLGIGDGSGLEVLSGAVATVLDVDAEGALLAGDWSALDVVAIAPTDESVLVFSSGTTGMPKAVRHTHGSMVIATEHWVRALGLGPTDRLQVATPPSHILGLLNLLAAAAAAVPVRLHARFDLDEVLRRIESDGVTIEMAVAPIALAMANHPDLERFDLSSLRYIMWGATPVTASVAEEVTRRTGVRWLPAYGASELPVLACNPVDRPDAWRLDSAGLPPAGVELRAADLDTGAPLPPGEIGEIQARSASVMAGYLPDDANADAFTADGWYRTGDVGWLEPEGWVHLTDRAKEMIKVSGFQVAPAEVEAVLHGHPAVVDCAVFGIPHEAKGEVPVAAVQLEPGHDVTPEALQRTVADALATYKQIHHVVIVDAIPRLPSGKVLRRTLRDEWAPQLRRRLMDVRLSAEQQALRDSAAQVVRDLGPSAVGQLDDAERTAKLDASVTAAGWRELRAPDDWGSPWASGVEACLVAEQLARGVADTAFIGPTLAAELRRRTGARPTDERETIAMLPHLGALADARDPRAVAVDAAEARAALALQADDDGWRVASVALGTAAVRVDLTRPTASVEGSPTLAGGRPLTADDLMAVAALGLAMTSADLVGTMQGAVDLACGYAADRRQYGQPVGAFQAVQHLLADAFVATEGARSATLHAAWAVDALPPAEAVVAGSVAKAFAARAARSVCETAIQVHGGIGNTWECLAHVHLRRALLSTELFGGVDACLQRVLAHHVGGDDGLR